MSPTATDTRSAQEIERSIIARRESLKVKLHEIEHRLSPGERLRQARERIDPQALVPWAAVGAVATGAWLAARGLRRPHAAHDGPSMETVRIDVAVPTVIVP